MEPLRHIVEPSRLLVTWQPADDRVSPRTRRVVAEVIPHKNNPEEWVFRYFFGTEDLQLAIAAGFKGYPAFKLEEGDFSSGVRESLLRRLPPRNREDFSDYLALHRLPSPFLFTDVALIGYTGARLPSDGFAFVPEFPMAPGSLEYVLEVAGVRHNFAGDVAEIGVGDAVQFVAEPDNAVDDQAIAIHWKSQKLGYVNRVLTPAFHHWLASGTVSGHVERKNGKTDRPMIYVRVLVECTELIEAA